MPIWAALAGAAAAVLPFAQTQPVQTLTPSSVAFGAVPIGGISPAQTLTFTTNTAVTFERVDTFGPFGVVGGSCGFGRLAAGASCTINVSFTPSSLGDQSGNVTVTFDGNSLRQTSLTGTGVPQATTTLRSTTTTTTGAATTISRLPPTTTTTRQSGTTTTTAPPDTTTTVAGLTTTSSSTGASTTTVPPPPVRRGPTLDAAAAGGRRAGPPGIGITVTGSGFPPEDGREQAAGPLAQTGTGCDTVYFFLGDRRLGSARPSEAGEVHKAGLSMPGDLGAGPHVVVASCRPSGEPVLASSTFEVTEAGLHRNLLATSMPRADQVAFGLDQLLLSALAVAGLLVLIAFPAELFNTTLEGHYDEVRGWLRLRPRSLAGGRHHAALLALFLVVSGPLWFAIQPTSGFDVATVAGALGLSVATALFVFASDMPAVVHVRRRYGERAVPITLPGSLAVAVACVVLSRAIDFQPGYFYGLVGGLALSRALDRDESGRLAAGTTAGLLALSIGAWLVLLPVADASAESGRTAGWIMLENVLGGIFWATLDSLVIALLPLRLLQGEKIAGWSRAAWVALYGVTLLAFVHILLRPSTGYVSNTSATPTVVVIGLFVGFALFSTGFWAYFRFRPASAGEALPYEVQGAAGTEPGDVLLGQGVGAEELERRPVGAVQDAGDRPVGGQPVQPEDRDAV